MQGWLPMNLNSRLRQNDAVLPTVNFASAVSRARLPGLVTSTEPAQHRRRRAGEESAWHGA